MIIQIRHVRLELNNSDINNSNSLFGTHKHAVALTKGAVASLYCLSVI
jgi:hypothetical protein